MRSNIESKNVWQQIFMRKYLGSKFFSIKNWGQNGKQIVFKENFLGRKFWGAFLEEQILVRRKFHQKKYFGGIFISKISL